MIVLTPPRFRSAASAGVSGAMSAAGTAGNTSSGSSSGARATKAKSLLPNSLINWSMMFTVQATGVPAQCLPKRVPPGMAVRVRAYNGTAAGNAQPVFLTDRASSQASVASPLAPLDDVLWPVNNTGKIWFFGTAGDGIVVSIVTPAAGS